MVLLFNSALVVAGLALSVQAQSSSKVTSSSGFATTTISGTASSPSASLSSTTVTSVTNSTAASSALSSTTTLLASTTIASGSTTLSTSSSGPTATYPATGPLQSAPLTPPLPGSRNSTRSPLVRGAGRWAPYVARAKSAVAKLTLEEKVNVTTGVGWEGGHCVGNTPPIPSIGFPGLCLEDSPLGVRDTDHVTAFPAGINAAATWDRNYIQARGAAMGAEFRTKGANIQLGPMMNMGRVAEGGRNWEGFGADPYLTGEAAYATIVGIQSQGVQATAKHFVANEQEHSRTTSSSNLDDRTMHEIYTHPFLRSVAADVASVMCSYNLVNGTYACESDATLNQLLKHELGFQGYVQSDWQATESTNSAEAGLDMTMPGDITFNSGNSYFGGNLTAAVHNGIISEKRVDDMATRILAAWYMLGQDKNFPPVNFDAFNPHSSFNKHVDAQADHAIIARTVGAASTVLLKNVNNALPLKKPRTIALIGSDAGPAVNGPDGYGDRGGLSGTLAMGWGSGTDEFPYLISPLEAIQAQAVKDHTTISWYLNDFAPTSAGAAAQFQDAAIVFVNSDSGEDYITVDGNEGDRKNLTAWHNGDALISAVAKNNANTIVVVHSVGPLIVEPWIENPNITAVLWAGLPGQESGNALVDVLYGAVNPSAKLPYTIAKQVSDYPAGIILGNQAIKQIPYNEGLNIDYRHFDANNIVPRFEFGFGLSYTTFSYSNLNVQRVGFDTSADELSWAQGHVHSHDVGSSLADWLHEPYYQVTYTIRNTGKTAGAEVSQLYLNYPTSAESPPSQLRGFARTPLSPGQSNKVQLTLSRYDLSVWNVVEQGWSRPQGTIGVTVGASSRDAKIKGSIAPALNPHKRRGSAAIGHPGGHA